jgi:class 3 adenylate cyclase
MNLAVWLQSLGLERYTASFGESGIDEAVLTSLTTEDLKNLGVKAVGDRRKLLNAIALLRDDKSSKPSSRVVLDKNAFPPDTAERRQVTVMFVDLVGSTELSARMDPEDLREVIAAYQKCVGEAATRLGGSVAKYMGDGVLIYFGYPIAHEDDAECAVRAGLNSVNEVAALKLPVSLKARFRNINWPCGRR